MGEIAHSLADRVIITNDNPRTESPEKIVSDILKGIDKDSKKVEIILNRKEAIKRGIRLKGNNDILLIAGKGHEPYQEVGNRRIPFSDKEVVREIFGDK
jgi:UDP-N-acetylmuramoyl-L-alanyl-D-glutamate--2,6-diaminopimelate ligase